MPVEPPPPALLSASSSSSAAKTCGVEVRCHLRSLLQCPFWEHTQNTPHKITSTIVASLERLSTSYHRHPRDPGDNFHVRLQFTVFNQSSVKAAQGNPRKRRSPRGVSQSARPHGKDVQAMGVVGGGWMGPPGP
jgi:hypothetical protein